MGGAGPRDRWGDIYANAPVKKMIALYDYDPQELSPNVDAEVELVRLLWLQLLALVAV
jgi:RIMS-binding protein 2